MTLMMIATREMGGLTARESVSPISLAITTAQSVRCSVSMGLWSTKTVARCASATQHQAICVQTGIISPARMTQRVSLGINVVRSSMNALRVIACAIRRLAKRAHAPAIAYVDLASASRVHRADVTNPSRVT